MKTPRLSFKSLTVEQLEDRSLPSLLTVTTTADSGVGSFRQAILDSNASAVLDTIEFDIDTGVQTIAPVTALPTVSDPVVIDATTQDGFSGSPLIVLNGAGAGGSTDGLLITSGHTTVRGLVINGFGGQGIEIRTNGNNLIVGNYIGTNDTGTAAVQYGPPDGIGHGVYILSSSNNTIGGTAIADRNMISGNRGDGIAINGVGATGNVILGNYLGTNADGSSGIGNQGYGVSISGIGGGQNIIGGTDAGAGNLISGNMRTGIDVLSTTAPGNVIQGNLIGTNAVGTSAIANGLGVSLASPNNIVGGASTVARNLISGNTSTGVAVVGSPASGNVILGNYVGSDITGGLALRNGGEGLSIYDADDAVILDNLIRSNGGHGVYLSRASRATIEGNNVRYNAGSGLYLRAENQGVASDNVIRGNVISANSFNGIWISGYHGTAANNVVQGNLIGTNSDGTVAEGNGQAGVYISNASYNQIGGTDPADRNIISGNLGAGLLIIGVETPARYNSVQGNFIGVDVTGTQSLGNGTGIAPDSGVVIFQNAQFNTIGGSEFGAGNVVGGNQAQGIFIGGNYVDSGIGVTSPGGATDNIVAGNFIGTDSTGTLALGNAFNGIALADSAANNTIGGLGIGSGNIIAFNDGNAIFAGLLPGKNSLPQSGNAFLSNSSYSNGGLGIDLGADFGVTPNDLYGHIGPNNYQNFPQLTSAISTSGVLSVTGTLTSTPDTQFTVQVFASDSADPSGFGEGQRLLGSIQVTTDAAGNASFAADFGSGSTIGNAISSTATDSAGNTSEFSESITALRGNESPIVTVPAMGPTVVEEGTVALDGISISDSDAGPGELIVTITVPAGAGILFAINGGGNALIDGANTPSLVITGSLDAINLALGTLAFSGATDFYGTAQVEILANDLGNSGAGGAKTGAGTVTITVNRIYPPLVADLGVRGLWHFTPSGDWVRISTANVESSTVSANGETVIADFGSRGLRQWTPADGWTILSNANVEFVRISKDGSTVIADFGAGGLRRWDGNSWVKLTPANVQNATVSADGAVVVADFGVSGIYRWTVGGGWERLLARNPERYSVSADGGTILADFGSIGLWKWTTLAGGWIRLTHANVENVVVSADSTTAVADFGASGLWQWTDIGGWIKLSRFNAEQIAVSDTGETIVADLGIRGIWRWTEGTGQRLSRSNAQGIALSPQGAFLAADFGAAGLRYVKGAWVQVTQLNPEKIAIG